MAQTTVRITEQTREVLRKIAKSDGASMQTVLERAVEEYRRQRFLDSVNSSYAKLRKDPAAWSEHGAERATWDETLDDGLPEGEDWDSEFREPRSE